MASVGDGHKAHAKLGPRHPTLQNKDDYFMFRRQVMGVSCLSDGFAQFNTLDARIPDKTLGADGNYTYFDHKKFDTYLVGVITLGVLHQGLSDKIHNELGRLSRMPDDDPDKWQKDYKHVMLMDVLKNECEKDDFHSKKLLTQNLELMFSAFDGKSFEAYAEKLTKAINACVRADVSCSKEILTSYFDTRFIPRCSKWKMWKEVIMHGIETDSFENILTKGIARERADKLSDTINGMTINGDDDGKVVAVNYGQYDNDAIVYDQPRGGPRKPWKPKSGGKGKGKGKSKGKGGGGKNMSYYTGGGGKGKGGSKGGGKGRGKGGKSYESLTGKNQDGRCYYCDKPGHWARACWAKKIAIKRESVGASVNLCAFVMTNFDYFNSIMYCMVVALSVFAFTSSLTTSFASTCVVCMLRVVGNQRVVSLNTSIDQIAGANEFTYDTATQLCVVKHADCVHRISQVDTKVIGVAGAGRSSQLGFLNLRLHGVNHLGIPKIVTLKSGIGKMSEWEADTIVYEDAPVNIVAGAYIRSMGLGFHDDPDVPAYLWHAPSKTKIVLERRNKLLFLPVVLDE
jgi:hypothetical protein